MQRTILILTLIAPLLTQSIKAQALPYPEDVSTIDGIMKAWYEVVSGPAGQPRDYERDASLHMPDARVMIVNDRPDGDDVGNVMTLKEFHERTASTVELGFFEYEIDRVVFRHGAIAHIWSTYEWKRTEDGPVGGQGINSLQLYYDGTRWWISSWMFDSSSDVPPVPEMFLPKN